MSAFTRTGLLSAPIINKYSTYTKNKKNVDFCNIATPAPFVLRPLSEYYNPYGNNCSILCNHPVDQEANRIANENKGNDGKTQLRINDEGDGIIVPEVLFRRYTETDSRPQTPPHEQMVFSLIPTPKSKNNRRRCITPNPPNNIEADKTRLILDLRRSHSQDTIIKNGDARKISTKINSSVTSPFAVTFPVINKKYPEKKSTQIQIRKQKRDRKLLTKSSTENEIMMQASILAPGIISALSGNHLNTGERSPKTMRNKKQKRKQSKHKEFRNLTDPEQTQMATCSEEVAISLSDTVLENSEETSVQINTEYNFYINPDLVKGIKRELNTEILDNEFDPMRHKILEEAFRCNLNMSKSPEVTEQIETIKKELNLSPDAFKVNEILKLPRTFSRKNSRFELPVVLSLLNDMSPLDYLKSYVYVTARTQPIYNKIFNNFVEDKFSENRLMSTKVIIKALEKVMGHIFTESESSMFLNLIDCPDNGKINFRTWCGICCLCERIMGPQISMNYPSHVADPCYETESVDFDTFSRRIERITNEKLLVLLNKIKNS